MLCTGGLLLKRGTRASCAESERSDCRRQRSLVDRWIVGVAGLLFAHPGHWVPFIPPSTRPGRGMSSGVSRVVTGAAIVFYAYVGFDAVSTMSQETHDPRRTVPLALIASLAICTALYVLIALMITGLADYRALNVSDPVYVALAAAGPALTRGEAAGGRGGGGGADLRAVGDAARAGAHFLRHGARWAAAEDVRGGASAVGHAAHPAPLLTGATATIIAGVFPLNLLGELISIGTLLAFAIVCVGVIKVLRRRRPDLLLRPFRVPELLPCAIPPGRDRGMPGADGQSAARHVDTVGSVAGPRICGVRCIWRQAFAAAPAAARVTPARPAGPLR